jgi:hypothetical protein
MWGAKVSRVPDPCLSVLILGRAGSGRGRKGMLLGRGMPCRFPLVVRPFPFRAGAPTEGRGPALSLRPFATLRSSLSPLLFCDDTTSWFSSTTVRTGACRAIDFSG